MDVSEFVSAFVSVSVSVVVIVVSSVIIDLVKTAKDSNQIKQSDIFKESMSDLRKWLFSNLYTNSIAKKEEIKAERLIELLYNYYLEHIDLLPDEYKMFIEQNEDSHQVVADYIAGLTDDYAVNQFNTIFVPRGWKY